MRMKCLFLLALIIGLTVIGVLWLTEPTPGFTEVNALRLRRGMTLQQVESLFNSRANRVYTDSSGCGNCWWEREGLCVSAEFDKNGLLTLAFLSESFEAAVIRHINVNESFLEMLRRWLRL